MLVWTVRSRPKLAQGAKFRDGAKSCTEMRSPTTSPTTAQTMAERMYPSTVLWSYRYSWFIVPSAVDGAARIYKKRSGIGEANLGRSGADGMPDLTGIKIRRAAFAR